MDSGTNTVPLTGETQSLLPPILRGAPTAAVAGMVPMEPRVSPERDTSEDSRSEDSWIGRHIHSYAIEELLGAGGMGRVYRGQHTWLELPVAIKILNPALQADPTSMARFQREAQICARLTHPNIVKATDGGAVGNSVFLVTELVQGTTLAEHIQRQGPLGVADACYVIREVAMALQHAHERGLVHRDIKPANIMLSSEGRIKLLDLGLARSMLSNTALTSTGQIMGTVDYISPEQAADTRRVDARSDIYSLGCTFYYLLTGHAPFAGQAYDTAVSKILAHAEEDPPPIDVHRTGVAAPVKEIVQRMTRKKLEERYASAQDVANAVAPWAAQAALAHGGVPVSSPSTAPATGIADGFEAFADRVLTSLWIGLRWVLLLSGFLTRELAPTRSRMQSTQWVYRPSLQGFGRLGLLLLLGFLLTMLGIPQFLLGIDPPPIEIIEVR